MFLKEMLRGYCLKCCMNGFFEYDTVYGITQQFVGKDLEIYEEFVETPDSRRRVINVINHLINDRSYDVKDLDELKQVRDILKEGYMSEITESDRTMLYRNREIFQLWAKTKVYFDMILESPANSELYRDAKQIFLTKMNFICADEYVNNLYEKTRGNVRYGTNLRRELAENIIKISKLSSITEIKKIFDALGNKLLQVYTVSPKVLNQKVFTLKELREKGLLRDCGNHKNRCDVCGMEGNDLLIRTALKGYRDLSAYVCKDCFKEVSIHSTVSQGKNFMIQFKPLTEDLVKEIEGLTDSRIVLEKDEFERLKDFRAIQLREDLHNSCDLCNKENLQSAINTKVKSEDNHERVVCEECYGKVECEPLTPKGEGTIVYFEENLSEGDKEKVLSYFKEKDNHEPKEINSFR